MVWGDFPSPTTKPLSYFKEKQTLFSCLICITINLRQEALSGCDVNNWASWVGLPHQFAAGEMAVQLQPIRAS